MGGAAQFFFSLSFRAKEPLQYAVAVAAPEAGFDRKRGALTLA